VTSQKYYVKSTVTCEKVFCILWAGDRVSFQDVGRIKLIIGADLHQVVGSGYFRTVKIQSYLQSL